MSLAEMIQRAENKDPKAMFELAEVYYYGKNGVKEDDEKAYRLYKELETLTPDDGMVLYRLGKCYELGLSVEKNIDLALEYFQKAVEKGAGIACWRLGDLYKAGEVVPKDITKCLDYMVKGVELGSHEAAVTLGNMYHFADGVEKDDAKSFEYYKIAADFGNVNAYYRLGVHSYNGWGVKEDKAQGMEYWKKGAELNQPDCMNIIGLAYLEEDTDLQQDTELGLYWLEQCADRGLPESRYTLGKTYLRGLHGVPRSEKKGVQHLRAAAEAGHAGAMVELGNYLMDQKAPESYSEAYNWLLAAAEKGEVDSYSKLGMLLLHGAGVKKDTTRGIEYLEKGAEQGDQVCMNLIGRYYIEGKTIPQNIDRGLYWLEKATDLGLPDSRLFLGQVYLKGLHGVPKNEQKGVQYLEVATESGWREIEIPAMMALGDYYAENKTTDGLVEALKWYEACADKGVPKAARLAVLGNQILAAPGITREFREQFGYEFNRDEWAKVASFAQKEIALLLKGDFEGRDAQLETARKDLSEAKYQQAICCYEMREYPEVISLLQDVSIRESDLLCALAQFRDAGEENFNSAFKTVVDVFLHLEKGEELTTEEQELRATAASMIATGYSSGVPGILPQRLDYAEETLRSTISYLTDADWINMLNKKLEEFGFSAAAPIVTTPPKPVVDPPSPTPVNNPPKPTPVNDPPKPNPSKDPPKPAPSDDPPKPGPEDGGDGPGIKPLLYALIGLAGLAVVLLLVLVLGNKDNTQTNIPDAVEPTAQVTVPVEVTETPVQTTEVAAPVGTVMYQLPTYSGQSYPADFYASQQRFEYSETGSPVSIETEVEGILYRANFIYKKYFIYESEFYEDDELVCSGHYNYENGVIQSISYTVNSFGEVITGSVDFFYSQEGDTYSIDVVPNIEPGYYYLPESFIEIPGVGSVPFGVKELRFEYQLNGDGTIRQLHVINKEAEEYDTAGWVVQYHSNGVPSMIGYEFVHSANNYQTYYDEEGFPVNNSRDSIEHLSTLTLDGRTYTESELLKIIGYTDPTGEKDYFQYELYEIGSAYPSMTRKLFNPNGELLEEESTEYEYYSYELLDYPFLYIFHVELDEY